MTVALIFAAAAGVYLHFENTSLTVTEHVISGQDIPESFDGYQIIQISDLHNTSSDKLTADLTDEIKERKPDLIVITGDLIDSRHADADRALDTVRQIAGMCPIFYVTGNHEARTDEYEDLAEGLKGLGVHILSGQAEQIEAGGEAVNIVGIDDPDFAHEFGVDDGEIARTVLRSISYDKDMYTILLSHRPELLEVYAEAGAGLVFSGHAHGGQIRLPFIRGLVAPDQGFFPKYTAGTYKKDDTVMVVSRGIGNSIFPFRVGNRPELVSVTLKSGQEGT